MLGQALIAVLVHPELNFWEGIMMDDPILLVETICRIQHHDLGELDGNILDAECGNQLLAGLVPRYAQPRHRTDESLVCFLVLVEGHVHNFHVLLGITAPLGLQMPIYLNQLWCELTSAERMPLATEEQDDVPAFAQDIGTADEGFFLAFLSVCATSLERDAAQYLLPAIALAHTVRTRGSRRHVVTSTQLWEVEVPGNK